MSKSRRTTYTPPGGLSSRAAWAIIIVVAVYAGIALGAGLAIRYGAP